MHTQRVSAREMIGRVSDRSIKAGSYTPPAGVGVSVGADWVAGVGVFVGGGSLTSMESFAELAMTMS